MKEQVFFIIEGQELVLDQVLVEFDETPIFFVCKYNQDYFISSCADLEEERYIVTRISLNRLSKMLHGKITMRELILQADKFWDIIVGEDAGKDIVVEESISKMPLDVLHCLLRGGVYDIFRKLYVLWRDGKETKGHISGY